ncbi:unnamed protein product [Linum tenue]|uniref:Acyl carrier protein n=1 Tax=Linum tenue TaxID=586396 RepID=A0AAV0LH10_9ROSI|nr:unnamed protein product [Linum tenue]CAI0432328.1 unnamed protein product [Linum tenue]
MAAASTSSFIPLKPRPTPRGLSTIAVLKLGAPLSFSFRRPVLAPARLRISCVWLCFKQAKPETVEKVAKVVKKQLALPAETLVTGDSKFAALGADSLDTVEIVMGLEEEFDISVEEDSAQSIATVQDAADLIEELVRKKCA